MQPRNVYPIPEAIDGRRWSVQDGRPMVDLTKRKLFAPVGDNDADRFCRAHEMAHARITPKLSAGVAAKRHGVTLTALQVCEDRRVHSFLARRRIPCDGSLTADEAAAIVDKAFDRPRDIASLLVSVDGTGDYCRVVDAIFESGGRRGIAVDSPRFKELFHAVDAVCAAVARGPDKRTQRHPSETAAGFKSRTIPAAQLFDQLFPEKDDDATAATRAMVMAGASFSGSATNRWGTLKPVERAPMPLMRRPDRRGVRRRWVDEGAIPAAVHRLTTDGRIFSRPKRRAPGGTVLVDFSGSMSLDADRLREIIEAAPLARVAVYSGSGKSGRLVVVADRGRCADNRGLRAAQAGGGNVVDGPALRWLAGQSEPRIWVSDGMVTGCGDRCAPNLFTEAAAACRSAKILRVDDAESAALAIRR